MRALAQLIRRYCGEHLRTTIEQNLVLRWVRNEYLAMGRRVDRVAVPALHYGCDGTRAGLC